MDAYSASGTKPELADSKASKPKLCEPHCLPKEHSQKKATIQLFTDIQDIKEAMDAIYHI